MAVSVRSFLVRGLLAGLFAGVCAFGVGYVVAEPSIDAAIAIEQTGAHTHETANAEQGGTDVPRSLQSSLGLLTATAVAGTTLGGLVGVLSALALGRFGRLGVRGSTLLMSAIGFLSLYAVPFVAYPPNPPGVGQAETIGLRTSLYFAAVAISTVAAVTSVLVGRRLADRIGSWWAALLGSAGYLLVCGVALSLLPSYDEVPADFPATLLYSFRTSSFLTGLALWAVLGVVLAELAHRLMHRDGRAADPDRHLAAASS
jgi:predicted cobalt transporter CbtA